VNQHLQIEDSKKRVRDRAPQLLPWDSRAPRGRRAGAFLSPQRCVSTLTQSGRRLGKDGLLRRRLSSGRIDGLAVTTQLRHRARHAREGATRTDDPSPGRDARRLEIVHRFMGTLNDLQAIDLSHF
jgi:hypothetical protein